MIMITNNKQQGTGNRMLMKEDANERRKSEE